MASGGGGRGVLLILLLVLLGGLGTWNYRRNLEAESAEPRPFASYADADVEALLAAYHQEMEQHIQSFEAVTGRRVDVRDGALLGEQIREFERIQSISRRTRELARLVAKSQVAVGQLEEEKRKRSAERPVYKLYLRRLLTLRT